MDSPRYDIYLTGKLAEGVQPDAAGRQLAALFKSTPAAMAGLLTGKPQLLKRGLDKATALKYRDALLKAGVLVAFKAQPAAAPPSPPAAAAPRPAPAITLAPAGGDLLTAAERSRPPIAEVDTSGYQLAPLAAPQPTPTAAVAPPDTGHLSLAPAGSDVLTEAERERPPAAAPDTSHLSLEPADAGPLAGMRPPPPPAPDTGHLRLVES